MNKRINSNCFFVLGRLMLFSFVVIISAVFPVHSQTLATDDFNRILLPGIIEDGDTLPLIALETVTVQAEMKFATKREKEAWDRLKYNVKKAYPYAIIAAARLHAYENELKSMQDESARKAYMKEAEKQLKHEFEGQLKKLTVKQGRILIKLIDRETGKTSYDLVRQLRGNFSAWMWQNLALLFDSDLKSEYDATGSDRLIELAIAQIESGAY
jgi:Domain of unknown function (DUF4294)